MFLMLILIGLFVYFFKDAVIFVIIGFILAAIGSINKKLSAICALVYICFGISHVMWGLNYAIPISIVVCCILLMLNSLIDEGEGTGDNKAYKHYELYDAQSQKYIKLNNNCKIAQVESIDKYTSTYGMVVLVEVHLPYKEGLYTYIYDYEYDIHVGDEIEVSCDRGFVSTIVETIGLCKQEELPKNMRSCPKVLRIVEYKHADAEKYDGSYDDCNSVNSFNVYNNCGYGDNYIVHDKNSNDEGHAI